MSITDEDLQRARELVARWRSGSQLWDANDVAQALADERERALAPVLALADGWAALPVSLYSDGPSVLRDAAAMIRDATGRPQAVDGAGGAR